MAIEFTHKVTDKYLSITTHGADESIEDTNAYGFSILKLAIEHQCSRVLCDERDLEYKLSLIDTAKLAQTAASAAKNLERIAVVCSKEYLPVGKFYENVAKNDGLVILLTTDYDFAVEWLS